MRDSRIDFFEIISAIYLFIVLLLILTISAAGNHKIFIVLVGLFPTILTIVVSLMIHKEYVKREKMIWGLPIVTSGIFYIISLSNQGLFGSLDGEILTGVTFILSMIYVMLTFYLFDEKHRKQPEVREHVIHTENPVKEEPKKSIEEYVHSIEDKSKALNFVIGRVYNKYHGGTSEMREKIRIPTEWYNEFSLIGFGTDHIDYEKLNEIITKFELHLRQFEKNEIDVFKLKINSLKNLIRDPSGKDQIIDVLDHNDKDPVRSYYEGAVKFCQRIREEMENQQLNLVENTYIPKTEEEEKLLKGEVDESSIDKGNIVKADKEQYPKHIDEVAEKQAEAENRKQDSDNSSGPSHP